MSNYKLIGYEPYTSNYNGTDYEMLALYVARDIENGIKPDKPLFCLKSKINIPLEEILGEEIQIYYNRYGKVEMIKKIN